MTTPHPITYALPMQRDVAAFHDAFDMPNAFHHPGHLPLERIELRIGLLREEGVNELRDAVAVQNIVLIVDALIDTVYVALGALVEMGQDAGDLLTVHDTIKEYRDPHQLLRAARTSVTRHSTFISLLEAAFLRQDVVRSVEILQAITRNALVTLMYAGYDPQPFFDEIQRANMSKLGADGKPVHSRGMELDGFPEGKVLKGANYRAPDIASILATLDPPRKIMSDFERGARLAVESMRSYFEDENERPIYDISERELTDAARGAVLDVLRDEQRQPGHLPLT